MKDHYLNIYNNLIKLTRNKSLFEKINIQDSFYDRMIVFFIHFAFFLKVYKKEDNKQYVQKLYDFVFNQIDISLQEAGHGDTTINKKMKNYVSIFHSIIKKVDYWESLKNEDFDEQITENSLSIPLKEAREKFEKEYLTIQIKKFNGNISKTAKFVGMERSALHRKLKGLGIKEFN